MWSALRTPFQKSMQHIMRTMGCWGEALLLMVTHLNLYSLDTCSREWKYQGREMRKWIPTSAQKSLGMPLLRSKGTAQSNQNRFLVSELSLCEAKSNFTKKGRLETWWLEFSTPRRILEIPAVYWCCCEVEDDPTCNTNHVIWMNDDCFEREKYYTS